MSGEKTPCKKCGGFRFEQRYHAICKDIGYIDAETGDFIEDNNGTDVLDITNGVEVFKCFDCNEPVEVKDNDGDEENE